MQALSRIQVRLLFLILLAVIPALGLTAYTVLERRTSAAAAAQEEALRLARKTAQRQEELISDARNLLLTLREIPQVRGGEPGECSALLSALLVRNPLYANLGVALTNGEVFCSALPLPQPVNIADQSYFQRAVAGGDFAIGDYQFSPTTGRASLIFGYPLIDIGQVQRVLFAALDLAWLNELAAEADLPQGSTLTVQDGNGTILVHYPDAERWVGQSILEAPVFQTVITQQGEGVGAAPGLGGTPVLFAFAPLPGSPGGGAVYVSVSIPQAVALAEADRIFLANIAGLGLVAALTLAAAWWGGQFFFLRQVNALLDSAKRLAAGDLNARAGLDYTDGELGDLARAFDEIAASFQVQKDALHASGATFANILEIAPDAIIAINEEEQITLFNKAAEKIFDYQAEEILGQPYDVLLPERFITTRVERIGQLAAVPEFEILRIMGESPEIWARRKDSTEFPAEISIARLARDGKITFIAILRDITERKQAGEGIQRQLQRLSALRIIYLAITSSLDLRLTLDVFLEQVISRLEVDAADILLLNPHTNTLEYAAGRGFRSRGNEKTSVRLGEGSAGEAALQRRVVHIPDLARAAEDFIRSPLLFGEDFVTYYAMPLVAKGQVKGVLEVFHRSALLSPDQEWPEFLETLAAQAAVAIDNASLFDNLQRSNFELAMAYDATIEGWSRALDLRDKETEGHTERVTEMTLLLAQMVGMKEEELVHVRRGALLHDMGKMGIPDNILLKSGRLTKEEWEVMRKHPVYAYGMLSPVAYLRPALDIPYGHHEKWEGSGYPRGLKGEEIPLAARIFAIVDVWDALRSVRPYRKAWPKKKALEYIKKQAGKHFDPTLVPVFLEMVGKG